MIPGAATFRERIRPGIICLAICSLSYTHELMSITSHTPILHSYMLYFSVTMLLELHSLILFETDICFHFMGNSNPNPVTAGTLNSIFTASFPF